MLQKQQYSKEDPHIKIFVYIYGCLCKLYTYIYVIIFMQSFSSSSSSASSAALRSDGVSQQHCLVSRVPSSAALRSCNQPGPTGPRATAAAAGVQRRPLLCASNTDTATPGTSGQGAFLLDEERRRHHQHRHPLLPKKKTVKFKLFSVKKKKKSISHSQAEAPERHR